MPFVQKRRIEDRLEEKIDRSGGPDACHPWTGKWRVKEYGAISYQGRHWLVHRLIWTLAHGEPPSHIAVRHSCDNPPCANLRHLSTGTWADNSQDMVDRSRTIRHRLKTCAHGHPRTPENRYVTSRGAWDCKPCRIRRGREQWERQKANRVNCSHCSLVTTTNYLSKHIRRRHPA